MAEFQIEPGAWDPLSVCRPDRIDLLLRYSEMLGDVNRRINLISRESSEDRWMRHILHSLCLGRMEFPAGAHVVDWGTGGGLPLIPLAAAFPDVRFTGVDAVGKKVLAVRSMIRRLGLSNADAIHARAESWEGTADYSVSRATAPLATLWSWHRRVATNAPSVEGCWPAGLVCLKGGDLSAEIDDLQTQDPAANVQTMALAEFVSIPDFVGKHIVTVTRVHRS